MVFFLAFCTAVSALASEDKITIKGETGFPYFNKSGFPSLIYCDSTGKIHIKPINNSSRILREGKTTAPQKFTSRPHIKKDKSNRLWIVWQQDNNILLGRITDNRIIPVKNLSQHRGGNNFSPFLAFSLDNQPWITWIHHNNNKYHVIISDFTSGQSWALNPQPTSPVFSPRIIIDFHGKIWLFWVGQHHDRDKIFFSRFNREQWRPPAALAADSPSPQIHPAVALDQQGFPWVVWSAYDGSDYEIYVSCWKRSGWQRAETITRNNDISDAEPSLSLYLSSLPMISWTQSSGGKRDVFLTFKQDDAWIPPINISKDEQRSASSVLISEGSKIMLSWEDDEKIYFQSLPSPAILASWQHEEKAILSLKAPPPLQENKFTGFGDSITYGWENGPTPENGYVPRLQKLLKAIFTNPEVTKRGVPGEPTWDALGRITQVIAEDKSQYLLLMEGTNDVSTASYSMDTTAFNLREMVNKCFQYGVMPLISTITPRAGHRWTTTAQERTFDLNEKITQLALDMNIILADNFTAFYDYPLSLGGTRALIAEYPDNLHPNGEGYRVISETWFEEIITIPFPPVNLAALRKERAGAIILSWEENPRIGTHIRLSHYRIYRKQKSNSNYAFVGSVAAAVFSFSDNKVSFQEDYHYALRAININQIEGPLTDPIVPIRGEPFPPTDVLTQSFENKTFLYREYINRVTWEESGDNQGLFTITRYRIYRKNQGEADSQFSLVGEVDASHRLYQERNISSLEEAQNYIYGVSSLDQENNESLIGKG